MLSTHDAQDKGDPQHLGGCLRVGGGHLWIEGCDTVALAERFGTPIYVVSDAQLRANCRTLRTAFERHWTCGRVEFLPSLKANYVLAIRELLNEEGVPDDVFSANEQLHVALRAGVPADRISVNGSAKSPTLLRAAVLAGTNITLDSAHELKSLLSITTELDKTARIRLRIRPDHATLTEGSDFFPGMAIRDAAQLYKPGIEPSAARAIGRRALSHGRVEAHGPHDAPRPAQCGTGGLGRMAAGFGETAAELCKAWAPWTPKELDISG